MSLPPPLLRNNVHTGLSWAFQQITVRLRLLDLAHGRHPTLSAVGAQHLCPARRRGACATPPRGALLGRGGQPLAASNSWDRNPCLRTRSCRPCNSACDCYMGDELHADMMQSTCARPTRGATLLGGSFQGPCSLPLLHVLPADVERGSSPCSLSKPELPGPAAANARDHLWPRTAVMLATPRPLLVPLHPSLRL